MRGGRGKSAPFPPSYTALRRNAKRMSTKNADGAHHQNIGLSVFDGPHQFLINECLVGVRREQRNGLDLTCVIIYVRTLHSGYTMGSDFGGGRVCRGLESAGEGGR